MARSFSKKEANNILELYYWVDARLKEFTKLPELQKNGICTTADDMLMQNVMGILRNISVDELNRNKDGIKVKLLKDNGFATIEDICNASLRRLEAINGIGAESANIIKSKSNRFIYEAKRASRIKLSFDDRNDAASRLVLAIYRYRKSQPYAESCEKLNNISATKMADAANALACVNGVFSWLFATKEQKSRAESGYRYLSFQMEGDYAATVKNIFTALDTINRTDAETAWKDFLDNPIVYYTTIEEIVPDLLENGEEIYGLSEDLAREIRDEPLNLEGLNCTLRKYQEWGVKYILHQKKVLLGDEMGLGKTIQAIAAMVSLRNDGHTHFMVVCPAGVIANWYKEIKKHSNLSVHSIYGNTRLGVFDSWIRQGGVAVTTYETTAFLFPPADFRMAMITVDEAHYIKNSNTLRTANVTRLCGFSDSLLFMTGTALENKVGEMIALIKLLQPQIASQIQNIAFMSAVSQFRSSVVPVYFRRKREEVLTELPDLIDSPEWVNMTSEEKELYEYNLRHNNFSGARCVSWNVGDLRYSSKANRLKEIVEQAEQEGRKVIVFSFFLDTGAKVREFLGDRCMEPINGSVPPHKRQRIIEQFDHAPAGSVLVAQIQSGGTGLNIQSASVVVLCEPQLKPSIENQAISRAYRMGQTRNVLVYRLLCDNSIDERIVEILERKQKEFDAFADRSDAAEAQMSLEVDEKTFGEIIREEIARLDKEKSLAVSPSEDTPNKNV